MKSMKIITYIKRHSVITIALGLAVIIILVIAGRVAARKGDGQAVANTNARQVSLVEAGAFRNGTSTVRTDGVVESVSQADLKSQVSAPVSGVYVSVGDTVYAGQVLVELQNADIRAGLESARASLSLAEGQYNTGSVSVYSVRKATIERIRESYTAADEVVRGQLDQFLFNTTTSEAPLSSYIADYALSDRIRTTRADFTNVLPEWKRTIDSLSVENSSDIAIRSALTLSKANLDMAGRLLDDVSIALNNALKNAAESTLTTLNTWKGIVSAGRASINGSGSALTSADASLLNALSSQGSPAEAQVSIAQAGVRNLEAQIAKTIIRSPISGKVASIPLRKGELASPGQLIATVVGGGGLEVKAYVSGEDLSRIQKGAKAFIRGNIPGVVDSVAPSVSQTNKKVEVRILVSNPDNSGLVVGQTVPVSISAQPNKSTSVATTASYVLPIQNIKIIPGDAYVFTVDENSKVVKHSVMLGNVEGDFVEVKSGITDDMKIVSPVYELEEGQVVDVR